VPRVSANGRRPRPLIVLDDDPTGTQAVADVPVLLEWDPELIREALAGGSGAVHVLTNSRAYSPARARATVRAAAAAAVAAVAAPRLALRGDSTLRAHLLEEYLAVCEGAFEGRTPPLLLVPALPTAGRVTLGGVHLLERDGRRVPLHETEYARDGTFAYRDARLLQWAEDRSGGYFRRVDGREVGIARLRDEGPEAVAEPLLELAARGVAAACAPDAETVDDLRVIAAGLATAEARGAEILVRSAPTFVGVVAGKLATAPAPVPTAPGGLLVICGSYVPTTTRQLAVLVAAYPASLVEVDPVALASERPSREIERAAREAAQRLAHEGLAVVATPRERRPSMRSFAAGERIADNLARVLHGLDRTPRVVVAKGGITSAVTARVGLRARSALCLGPLVDGVALWRLDDTALVVFPGNVGSDGALLDVVERILKAT
jgi:uncharacterized protein YgbK (DUF1537 family)